MSEDTSIVLATYNDIVEATVMKDKLQANGIQSFLENENPIGLNPLGGVELKILSKDKDAAEKIVAQ